MNNLLILGAGFSGFAAACACRAAFDQIHGTTRSRDRFAQLREAGISPLVFDGDIRSAIDADLEAAIVTSTHVLISVAPTGDGDPVLGCLAEYLAVAPNLQWLCYLSTVGVYGDHDGEWVDEDSECRPVSRRSVQRVEAEARWQQLAAKLSLPLAIFRLSGIYGPGRNAFVNIEKGTSRRLVKPGQVFNRIHRHDIGEAVRLAAALKADGTFNITDNEPAPPQDVVTWAHSLHGSTPPPEQDFGTAELSPMARSFYGENKRVSNAKSKRVLGLEYVYPDYRAALTRMWQENDWR
ncbi:MAG: SDR family oxidoreductase [Nitratireductor sp.]